MAKINATTIENGPKYPEVKVWMMSAYGGFHPTVAALQAAMRRAEVPLPEPSAFYQDAAGDGEDNLLRTTFARPCHTSGPWGQKPRNG